MQTRHRAQKLVAIPGATVAIVLAVVGCASTHHPPPPVQAAAATPAAALTAAPAPAPPGCTALVTHRHPADGTKVGISVTTAPGAGVTVVAYFPVGNRKKTARADSTGLRTFWFQVGSATPGYRVKVSIRVSAHGQKRSCRTSFTPRQPPPPKPAPTPTAAAAPAPAPKHQSGAWCTASVHSFMDSDHDEWLNDVYVHSNQPDTDATASGGGHSWSYYTNSSGYADIYLNGPPPGTLITVTVGGATCTTG
jgi:hypothetical protein